MPMKKIAFLFPFFIFFLFFLKTDPTFAYSGSEPFCSNPSNCTAGGVNYSNCANGPIIVPDSYCGGSSPQNRCVTSGSDIWTFYFDAKCIGVHSEDARGQSICSYTYEWKQQNCSAADRCEDPSVGNIPGSAGGAGGTGSNTSGHVLAGKCVESAYDGRDPKTACVSGGWYKTCCSANGSYPVTACSAGTCPNGRITTAGVTSCSDLTPTTTPPPPASSPPTPTCGSTCL